MEPWFVNVIPSMIIVVMFSVVPMVIGAVALYFIIKNAVKSALKEHENEMHR